MIVNHIAFNKFHEFRIIYKKSLKTLVKHHDSKKKGNTILSEVINVSTVIFKNSNLVLLKNFILTTYRFNFLFQNKRKLLLYSCKTLFITFLNILTLLYCP